MSINLPHIKMLEDDSQGVVLEIEGTEVFDFVEDHLIEKFAIEYEYFSEKIKNGVTVYQLSFGPGHDRDKLAKALEEVSPAEIERMYSLNNQVLLVAMYTSTDNKSFKVVPALRASTGRKNAAHLYAA